MIDARVERLLSKAEAAVDAGEIERADTYRVLADQAVYLLRREAKELQRIMSVGSSPTRGHEDPRSP